MRSLFSNASVSLPHRRRRRLVLVLLMLTFAGHFIYSWAFAYVPYPGITKLPIHATSSDMHPVTQLISDATARFESLLDQRSSTLEDAAQRYRQRRGRHPPPGFDLWFKEAMKNDAIIVESFFDRIHHDINPLWALNPREMRTQAASQPQIIKIRNRKVTMVTDDLNRQPWIQHWTALVKDINHLTWR
ncbi:Lipopolysaccharide-modifying protein [Akanthomyces lecanii RCEF 1005]|uniref:Lipopolysaccharide-modifying protein n=1 Tax=Akanthomyces lecanii RCEF 1005 TaxID=1081108 RepID=A0A167VA06_CORDF|nr:Lipopolysaccharide-modifying protein [Akanthomyces lecanii RCEF 1005]